MALNINCRGIDYNDLIKLRECTSTKKIRNKYSKKKKPKKVKNKNKIVTSKAKPRKYRRRRKKI